MDLTELDNRVAQLATKLEVACQDTSSQLERTIEDISRNVPRLNIDLQFMRESTLSLQRELVSVHQTAAKGSEDETTTKALENLKYLDAVKKGMEAARSVLQEAENWSTLESEITTLLKESSYAKASSRLSEAAKSMSVFQHTPEYESRRTLMINLQNQTEAALSAALVAAINSRDIGACREFHEIFEKIEREGEFRNYYFGTRRASVLDLWKNTSLSDVQEGAEVALGTVSRQALKFSELLARFFADVLVLVNEERSSIPSIFSSSIIPTEILALFIQSIFESLTPSLSQRLSGLAAYYGATALPELITAFKQAEEFAIKVEKIVEKMTLVNLGALAATSPTRGEQKGHARQKSKRLSISRKMTSHRTSVSMSMPPTKAELTNYTWQQPLFEAFIDFQCEYSSLEKRLLEDSLAAIEANRLPISQADDTEIKARILRENAMDVFGLAEEALGRCLVFTHGYGAVGLLHGVNTLFEQFFNSTRAKILQSLNFDSKVSDPNSIRTTFDTEILTQEGLASFQLALNLLNTSRTLKERLVALDLRFKSDLTSLAHSLRTSNTAGGGHVLEGTAKGEAELLAQSTLNSMELLNLFEMLETYPAATPFTVNHGTGFAAVRQSASAAVNSMDRVDIATSAHSPVLRGSFKALAEFARSTQTFLQQLILAPLISQLSIYPSLPIWSASDQLSQRKAYDFALPTFSLSPTPTMQKVCDALMALPRMFEDYAVDDEALSFSIETLPFVERDLALKDYLEWVSHSQESPAEANQKRSPRTKRRSVSSPTVRRLSISGSNIAQANPLFESKAPPLSVEMVSSAWLSSITYSLLSYLTRNTLPMVRALSPTGAAQLAYDLGSLSNIARALNAEWEELEIWRECCELNNEEGRKRWLASQGVSAFAQGVVSNPSVDSDSILRLVARLRGWISSDSSYTPQ